MAAAGDGTPQYGAGVQYYGNWQQYPQMWQQPGQQQQQQQQQQQGMQMAPAVGATYQDGYQAAVRDMSAGKGGGWWQLGIAALNAGVFLGLPLYLMYRFSQGGGAGSRTMMDQVVEQMNPVKKRNFRVNVKGIKFADVIGIPEAKEEVKQYVDFLKNPDRFSALGARLPRGALLTGQPGTGKTLLAKAVAGESGVSFYSCSGADFVEIFGGSGPKRVRELFGDAKANAPAVIFIDELDAVGSKRSAAGDSGIGGEENRTTNALLAEMDGMGTSDNVVVFAATNHPDVLDSALVRPGRFDRKIEIPVPDEQARVELFEFYLSKITTATNFEQKAEQLRKKVEAAKLEHQRKRNAPDFAKKQEELTKLQAELEKLRSEADAKNRDKREAVLEKQIAALEKAVGPEEVFEPNLTAPTAEEMDAAAALPKHLAARTPGVTPASINAIVNEAALVAADREASFVTPEDVQNGIDNVLIGKKHRQRMSDIGLTRTAYHEAGHAVAQWMLGTQTAVIKVSVIPRGRAGGYTQFRSREALDPRTDAVLFDELIVLLGGRCAEKIFFNDTSTGAQDDLTRAFKLAQGKVQHFGMDRGMGPIAVDPNGEQRGRAFSQVSESLKSRIEDQAKQIVQRADEECMKLLTKHKKTMESLAQSLVEKRELDQDQLKKILGEKVVTPPPAVLASAASA
eukprot:TRINITY_DN305_c0_g4_i2.p1 TRINITY_DN305_c0_g4~~TRINITY_DN305_c0_g4_i2.p1  ORF type:complete len:702 (+),score=325.35 TRINITY_DN305_c0_g4_i2:61-2106(+)